MTMHSYFYYEGTDGRHYCYAKTPTFTCPMAEPVEVRPTVIEPREGERDITHEHHLTAEHAEAITAAAAALGMDALKLGMALRSHHQRRGAQRERVNGKLTDTCAACGHRMEREGFRVWVEELPLGEDAQSRIADRLGFSSWRTVPGSSRYLDTKKEAQGWARDESRLERAPA